MNDTNHTIRLKDIFIGEIDGETESQKENFLELFYNKDSKYEEILAPAKFIISGRKGTGKTILARYIEKNHNKDKLCKIYNLKDFQVQQLIDLDNLNLGYDVISAFCKWFILVKMAELVVSQKSVKSMFFPLSSKFKLRKYYDKIYSENIFKISNYSTENSSKQKSTDKLDLTITGTANGGNSTSQEKGKKIVCNYEKKSFYELISSLEKKVTKAISPDENMIIVFDDLDELEGKISENKFYRDLIIKMLEIIKALNADLASKKLNAKIIVLLRSDVINSLQKYASNLNKLVTSGQVNLYWIDKNLSNPEKHPLMDMVLSKISSSTREYQALSKNELYIKLFPEKISDKEIIHYLLDYSFGRPRDIVHYLNIIKNEYPDATYFRPEFFRNCAQEYSNWFYDELLNELNIHENTDFVMDSLKLINDFKERIFKLKDIDKFFEVNKASYKHISDLRTALECMYAFGVIGNSWKSSSKNSGIKYLYSWGYRKDANDEPNFNQTFVVHYGLRKKFSI